MDLTPGVDCLSPSSTVDNNTDWLLNASDNTKIHKWIYVSWDMYIHLCCFTFYIADFY